MTAWPGTLPQNQFIETSVQDADAVLRTNMDAGPPSRRNKYTAFMATVTVPIIFNGAQMQAFNTFYRDTLKNGALSFTWTDPVTNVSTFYAFKQPPKFTLRRGGTINTRIWQGEMELEIQP